MHLFIPFASALSEACTQALAGLPLPHLTRLLTRLTPTQRIEADEYAWTPPHERALAVAWGWDGADGRLPFAALHAAADGIDVGERAWGELTPVHWHVGRDHVSLVDPAELHLNEAESRALFEAAQPLFESEGFAMAWGAPLRWYASHPGLAELATASIDRAVGRNVELWLNASAPAPAARLLRRLQSEVQLLWYPHAINEAREARGELAVNSLWLSGCGTPQARRAADIELESRLRAPLMASDWPAWAQAWQAVDADRLPGLLAEAQAGRPVSLTLAGERHAQRFDAEPRSLMRTLAARWKAPAPAATLEAL